MAKFTVRYHEWVVKEVEAADYEEAINRSCGDDAQSIRVAAEDGTVLYEYNEYVGPSEPVVIVNLEREAERIKKDLAPGE